MGEYVENVYYGPHAATSQWGSAYSGLSLGVKQSARSAVAAY